MSVDDAGNLWRPTAARETLQQRAEMLSRLRHYFREAEVLEVETPLLASGAATDPHIPSFVVQSNLPGESRRYLNTSPEFAMKRLLAAGYGSIYQVCKAFRQGEQGRWHNPEFTLLEWYRLDYDHWRLMMDVESLVASLNKDYRDFDSTEWLSYAECFQTWLDIDPLTATTTALIDCARSQGLDTVVGMTEDDRDGWLNLLISHCIQPNLGKNCLTFVYDYPASQAALARLKPGSPQVAERFELYIDGVEIANGFHELRDVREQRARFEAELESRHKLGLEPVKIDEYLLAALDTGLPDCAGVAMGLDRLLMVLLRADNLEAVLGFPYRRS